MVEEKDLSFLKYMNLAFGSKLSAEEKIRYFKMLMWYRRHPVQAARDILGINLAPHQRVDLKCQWRNTSVIRKLSRGLAKTFVGSVADCLYNILYTSLKVVSIGCGSFKQTKLAFQASEAIMDGEINGQEKKTYAKRCLKDPKRTVSRDPSVWSIQTKHNAIEGISPQGAARGFRAQKLRIDESNDMEADFNTKVVKPFLNVLYDPMNVSMGEDKYLMDPGKQNAVSYSGTIDYEWRYYATMLSEHKKRLDNGEPGFAIVEYDFEDTFVRLKNDKIKFFYKMNLKELFKDVLSSTVDFASWSAENKNRFIVEKAMDFPSIMIMNLHKDFAGNEVDPPVMFSTNRPVFIGIDPARSSADFAIVVATIDEKDPTRLHLINVEAYADMPYPEATNIVYSLTERYPNTIAIYMDSGGGGTAVRDFLREEGRYPVSIIDPADEFNQKLISLEIPNKKILTMLCPTAPLNTQWGKFMQSNMQNHRIILPKTYRESAYDIDDIRTRYGNECDMNYVLKTYEVMSKLKTQFINIKSSFTQQGYVIYNSVGKKDLFSASMYCCAAWMDFIRNELQNRDMNESIPEGFWIR